MAPIAGAGLVWSQQPGTRSCFSVSPVDAGASHLGGPQLFPRLLANSWVGSKADWICGTRKGYGCHWWRVSLIHHGTGPFCSIDFAFYIGCPELGCCWIALTTVFALNSHIFLEICRSGQTIGSGNIHILPHPPFLRKWLDTSKDWESRDVILIVEHNDETQMVALKIPGTDLFPFFIRPGYSIFSFPMKYITFSSLKFHFCVCVLKQRARDYKTRNRILKE